MFPVCMKYIILPHNFEFMDNRPQKYIERIEQLFISKGIKNVTMDMISRDLGISKKTLYKYFDNKKDVVRAVFFNITENILHKADQIVGEGGNAIDILLQVSTLAAEVAFKYNSVHMYELEKYYPDLFSAFIEKKQNVIVSLVSDNMKQGQREGLYREDLNIYILSHFHLAKIEMIKNFRIKFGDAFTQKDFFDVMFDTHIRGIVNRKGLEYYEKKLLKKMNEINLIKEDQ